MKVQLNRFYFIVNALVFQMVKVVLWKAVSIETM